jgi:C-terminal processing protease CtpA/Prc
MLNATERQLLVDQALALIDQLYVHLPLKRAMHAADPLQRLKLLKHRSTSLSEPAFHAELSSIFTRLRDLHTNYILPDPFRARTAYLPFRLEEFFEESEPRYVVTEVKPGTEENSFKRGAIVTHWNGVPIHRAVELNADREGGSNLDARHAQGLAAMTIRPLAMSLPPDEEWVVVTYQVGRRSTERRFEWQVFVQQAPETGNDPLAIAGERAFVLGMDAKAELERQARKLLFAPEAVEISQRVRKQTDPLLGGSLDAASSVDFNAVSKLPDVFSFRTVRTTHGSFGYIRLHTFNVSDDSFVEEFIRIAGILPQNGLILDVRNNGGGNILAGERLLQVLTPRPIEPERFYFINSPLTLRICEIQPSFANWKESIAQAVETGATFSDGFPLLPVEAYNNIGQKYQGPVVLVTDARCYSTTDIFSAGFQDHGIGKILGTSGTTGAGGANVWSHDLLLTLLSPAASPFKPLPQNSSFRVAVRRCTRVGKHAGGLIEELGVVPDVIHHLTRRDVLNENVDLINRAGEMLAAMPSQTVAAKLRTAVAARKVDVMTQNVDRIDLFINSRPFRSVDVTDGTLAVDLPPSSGSSDILELRGFRSDQLVASTRLTTT